MNINTMLTSLAWCGLLATMCPQLTARDVLAPWWRGAPRTTYQAWYPLTAEMYDLATVDSNEYGMPYAYAEGTFTGWVFTNGAPGPDGTPLQAAWFNQQSGSIVLQLPNAPESVDDKLFWIQITCSTNANLSYSFSVFSGTNHWSPTNTYQYITNWSYGTWMTHVTEWMIPHNPSQEIMYLDFYAKTFVEQIVAETWCTPEPATVAVGLCLGACALLHQRRRMRH
jgi:hypothetical protein